MIFHWGSNDEWRPCFAWWPKRLWYFKTNDESPGWHPSTRWAWFRRLEKVSHLDSWRGVNYYRLMRPNRPKGQRRSRR